MEQAKAVGKQDQHQTQTYYNGRNNRKHQAHSLEAQMHKVRHNQSRLYDRGAHQNRKHQIVSQLDVSKQHLQSRQPEQRNPYENEEAIADAVALAFNAMSFGMSFCSGFGRGRLIVDDEFFMEPAGSDAEKNWRSRKQQGYQKRHEHKEQVVRSTPEPRDGDVPGRNKHRAAGQKQQRHIEKLCLFRLMLHHTIPPRTGTSNLSATQDGLLASK